jgi:hypothetical protein
MIWINVCCTENMQHNYQHFGLQTLIDLLAVETEKYTKAYINGDLKLVEQQRAIIEFLVQEINNRKQPAKTGNVH